MNQSNSFFRRLVLLLRRNRFRSELDEEMNFHRAQAQQAFEAEGMSPKAARRAATRQFGNSTRIKEESHEVIRFRFESVVQDLRYAVRQLRRNPGFTASAVLVLALGIGASVAIFGFVNTALIRPLPYERPERLVNLYETIQLGPRFHLSYLDWIDWQKQNKSFSSIELYEPLLMRLKTRDGVIKANGATVSSGFFHTLGVTPVLGRDFTHGEDLPSAAHALLLSYSAWQRLFGGRADVIGQTLNLDGQTETIIGVLPRSFHFAPAEPADFWTAHHPSKDCDNDRGCHNFYGIARLREGVSLAAAQTDVVAITRRLEAQYPDTNRDRLGLVLPLIDVIVGEIRPILLTMLIGAAMLLLIATINVASLLLVRSESRRREIAVRGALGASTVRLTRQFITEGLLLAIIGGASGIGLAAGIMRLMGMMVPGDMLARMPFLSSAGLGLGTLGFACLATLLTGLVFAFAPTLRLASTARHSEDLREGLAGGRGTTSLLWRHFGSNLVIVELAIAVVLLVGAGLLGKSFYRLLQVDTGLRPDHLATLRVMLSEERYSKDEQLVLVARAIMEETRRLPGVRSVGLTTQLPLGDGDGISQFCIVGETCVHERNAVIFRWVSSSYMQTLGANILHGRDFNSEDRAGKPGVVLINQTLLKQYFAGRNPVGMHIYPVSAEKTSMEIVGVVNDLQEGQLDAAPRAAMYVPLEQSPNTSFTLLLRTSQTEESVLPAAVAAIHHIDPEIAVVDPITMSQHIHDSPSANLHRASAWIVGCFAGVALLLGVVGLYGVIAYSVSQRTREIGVRMALGAQRGSVYMMILTEAGWLTTLGITIGLLCSLGAAAMLRSLLFGTRAWDIATFAAVAIVLAASALLASYIPARRAAAVNPVEALRSE